MLTRSANGRQQRLTPSQLDEILAPQLRVHLGNSNIREVVYQRLLRKKKVVERDLIDLYQGERISESEFVEIYPLLPGHIDLLLRITSGLRARGSRVQATRTRFAACSSFSAISSAIRISRAASPVGSSRSTACTTCCTPRSPVAMGNKNVDSSSPATVMTAVEEFPGALEVAGANGFRNRLCQLEQGGAGRRRTVSGVRTTLVRARSESVRRRASASIDVAFFALF